MQHALGSPLVLFVLQASLVILVARTIGIATRWLKQPMVIAEVVAGIVLGPSLFGWIFPNVSAAVFKTASLPLLGTFANVGLLLFMFLVGLELDPQLLKKRVHASVAISHTSIIVPFALGGVLAYKLHGTLAPSGVRFSSFFLFMGVAMSITAFPVLARILVERRLLRSRVGAVTIACAAVDDVTAWCILAFVVSIVRATGVMNAVLTTVMALAYVGFMIFVAKPVLDKLAHRNKPGVSQNLVAAILLGLFLSSVITELIGIHALFGAFLFGAIIPKQGSFAAAIAEKLEDLVVVFLLPLFFAYSGLRTQIGLLDTASSWLTCGAITVVACVGKFGGSAVAARITGMSWRESSAIGILMNTRGLMELVVLNIGLDLGVISPTLFAMMVIMALTTTFMTTPLLERIYPVEELAKELADGPIPSAPQLIPARFTALVCVAYERSGPGLVAMAAALAGRSADTSRIYALRLERASDRASFMMEQREEKTADEAPLPLVEHAREQQIEVRPLSFVSSKPAADICDVASVKSADVILMGWHKPVLGAAMLTGTVHDVMRHADTTVAVLVDRGLGPIKRVLVPYVGRVHDRAALALANRLAENAGAKVTVLQVNQQRASQDSMIDTGELSENVVLKAVEHANPVEAALAESREGYDLVVVGMGAEWGLEARSFGVRTEVILRRSTTSVLVVRAALAPVAEPVSSREPTSLVATLG